MKKRNIVGIEFDLFIGIVLKEIGLAVVRQGLDRFAAVDFDKTAGLIVAGGRRERRLLKDFLNDLEGDLFSSKSRIARLFCKSSVNVIMVFHPFFRLCR